MNGERIFKEERWYNTTQAYTMMKMSRTTFWRRVSEGAIKWKLRRNFPGKWFKGRELNNFHGATI